MQYKIHPAIGIARVGNSPSDFFVGPETADEAAPPQGGYKDDSCRIKRQAARFRIWEYDDSGGAIRELTSAEAEIEWTVELGNRKAAFSSRNSGITGTDRDGLSITPTAATISGPGEIAKLDDGVFKLPGRAAVSVPLGEIRTDADARLLVLGGFGKSSSPTSAPLENYLNNDAWHDDVADGPVKARVRLNGAIPWLIAEGAWVIVAPPDFAPPVVNAITLYDRLFQYFVSKSMLAPDLAPPSFRRHILPLLRSASDMAGVDNLMGAHSTLNPASFPLPAPAREAIFRLLRGPSGGGSMPRLSDNAYLTTAQMTYMQKWKDGDFTDDWSIPPLPLPLTPLELDRGPLFHSVGAEFAPGIEAGFFLIATRAADVYSSAFRIDHTKVRPGDVGANMACPWQADFAACGSPWWPGQRPINVKPQGTFHYQQWTRGVAGYAEMVLKWPTLGFVVRQPEGLVEVERCDTASISLLTPSLDFIDVPVGSGGLPGYRLLPIEFDVSAPSVAATLRFMTGPTQPGLSRYYADPGSPEVVAGPTPGGQMATARLWILYTTGAVGSAVADTVIVEHAESGQTWTVNLAANTVARQTTKIALVLDRSGSMLESAGPGLTKIQSLLQAGRIFVDLAQEEDGIAIVEFNQNASVKLDVVKLGPATLFEPARQTVKNALALTPSGSTSVGDGIDMGRLALANAPDAYDREAMVILTDGKENNPLWIADVSGQVDSTTYAIGLGEANNVNVSALQTLTGNTGGYFLLTGTLAGDNLFRLTKYFLQILAGITKAEVVLDPDGWLLPGREERIPFSLTDAELGADVILLSPYSHVIDFQLETPIGDRITPAFAFGSPSIEHLSSQGVAFYRMRLPLEVVRQRPVQAGTWHAILKAGNAGAYGAAGPNDVRSMTAKVAIPADRKLPRLPYSLIVQARTGVSLRAMAQQRSREPGTPVKLRASLLQYGIPFEGASSVFAEVTFPDGSRTRVDLARIEPGRFEAEFPTSATGLYRFRIRASGKSPLGWIFQREQTLTAIATLGGDRVPNAPAQSGSDSLCDLISCWLKGKAVSRELREKLRSLGFNLDALVKCLDASSRNRRLNPDALREIASTTGGNARSAAYAADGLKDADGGVP